MKIFFLTLTIFGFIDASSQTSYYDYKKIQLQQELPSKRKKEINSFPKQDLNFIYNYQHSQAKQLFTLNNGNTVYALPQDNMYCIVPNMSHYRMPNLFSGKRVIGMTPGSAPPKLIIPEKTR